jgi:hypothetical protein
MVRYAGDHDGQFPSVPMEDGAPWWKVSYQGPENHSNTRRGWQLVRERYVSPDKFICPARPIDGKVSFENLKVEDYSDFPDRRFISFSIRIGCPRSKETNSGTRRVLVADLNPIAEKLPADYSAEFRLRVDEDLLRQTVETTAGADRMSRSATAPFNFFGSGTPVSPRMTSSCRRTSPTVARCAATNGLFREGRVVAP